MTPQVLSLGPLDQVCCDLACYCRELHTGEAKTCGGIARPLLPDLAPVHALRRKLALTTSVPATTTAPPPVPAEEKPEPGLPFPVPFQSQDPGHPDSFLHSRDHPRTP